jgi:hypothetical protein
MKDRMLEEKTPHAKVLKAFSEALKVDVGLL